MQFNINTDAVVKFSNSLEQLHRSALPIAIRGALNDTVYNVKTATMPKTAEAEFTIRKKNFFKANSKFEKASGFNISGMKATVGFFSNNLTGANNYAVKDLEQQEHGGVIGGKSFIAMKTARVGNSNSKNVRPNFILGKIKNVVDANKVKAKSAKQRYIRAAFMAEKLYGKQAFVLGNNWGGKNKTLSKIDEIWGSTRGIGSFGSRKLQINRTPLYTFRKGRKISVGGTNFMRRASLSSAENINAYYIKQAIRQIKRLQNK